MSESVGSFLRRAASAACLVLLVALPAAAQQPIAIIDAPVSAQFLSRFDFDVSAAKLAHPDARFSWDTHWAGDFDLVDYVHGRMTFVADYQALLGSEFRAFDPYQSNYLLEAASSYRLKQTEIFGVLSHVSRHYGDRFKLIAVAENSVGPRIMRRFTDGASTIEFRGDVRKVIARAYVDYNWFAKFEVLLRQDFNPRTSAYVRTFGELITIDPAIAGRDRQNGGRVEAGIRVNGSGGVVELFAGAEHVIDADQLDRLPQSWAFAGFRVLGK